MSSALLNSPAVANLEPSVEESYIIRVNYADFSKVQIQPAEKIFRCSQCKKEITNGSSEELMLTHNCNKFHTCIICNDKFSSTAKLDEHLKSHETKVTKIKSCFHCVHCQKQFDFLDQLLKHIKLHFMNLRYNKTKTAEKYCGFSKADARDEYFETRGSASGTALQSGTNDILSVDVIDQCSEASNSDSNGIADVSGDDTIEYVKEKEEKLLKENTLMDSDSKSMKKKSNKKRRKMEHQKIIPDPCFEASNNDLNSTADVSGGDTVEYVKEKVEELSKENTLMDSDSKERMTRSNKKRIKVEHQRRAAPDQCCEASNNDSNTADVNGCDIVEFVKEMKEELGKDTLTYSNCKKRIKKENNRKRRKIKNQKIAKSIRTRSVIKQEGGFGNVQNIHLACEYCNLSFDKITLYLTHLNRHKRKYKQMGSKMKVLGTYTSIKLVNEKKECTLCGSVLSSVEKLLFNHITDYHPDIKTSRLCLFCGKFFSSKCQMLRHRRIHTGEKPFMCPECPYSCNRMDNLRKHFFAVHKKLEFNVEKILSLSQFVS